MREQERKNEIINIMTDVQYYPIEMNKQEIDISRYTKLPIAQISALGAGFETLSSTFKNFVGDRAKSATNGTTTRLFSLTLKQGEELVKSTTGEGFIGAIARGNNQVGGGMPILKPVADAGQTGVNPLVCNPTTLFMATALISIDKKLDEIQEVQTEIIEFLEKKEKADLRGNLIFLVDVLNGYKHNWDSEKFKSSNHNAVLDIRRESEQGIIFRREQINRKLKKQSFLSSDRDVKSKLSKIQSEFEEYQLALYLYSFSSFLDVILLENFKSEYLNAIISKIDEYALNYRKLYTECYNQIENESKSSIQSHMLGGFASINKFVGQTVSKIPVVKNTQIDETLIETSSKLGNFALKKTEQTMSQLENRHKSPVRPFIDNINIINKLYNDSPNLLFDSENIYIGL